jgi:hypothetical protein
MLCISRCTDDTYSQQFGNDRNKFYIEFRCNMPCIKGLDVCSKCAEKSPTAVQTSKKFNHGKINEPLPEKSHIYGGEWYKQAAKKYGEPSPDVIEFALQYQKKAREGFTFEEPVTVIEDKVHAVATEPNKAVEPNKRTKKPKAVTEATNTVTINEENTVETAEPVPLEPKKRTRKPKAATTATSKNEASKKSASSAYGSLINNTQQLVHKEVVLPTHIETNLEEFDTDGFEIEYVKLEVFEANGTTYFRERTKNKLYRKIKDKGIGGYIGRWNPDTESIVTDIPDSDDEE